MIETFLWLLGYQFAGELLARSLGWPIPGAVLGMLFLFLTLCVRKGIPDTLRHNVPRLMTHMSLLFIPAGAGILAFWPLLAERPLAMAMAAVLLLSTLATLLVSALTLTLLLHLQKSRKARS